MSLSGAVEAFPLDDVLGLLSSTEKTGMLRVTIDADADRAGAPSEFARIWFNKGFVVRFVVNGAKDLEDALFQVMNLDAGQFAFSKEAMPPDSGRGAEVKGIIDNWRRTSTMVPRIIGGIRLSKVSTGSDLVIAPDEWNLICAGLEASAEAISGSDGPRLGGQVAEAISRKMGRPVPEIVSGLAALAEKGLVVLLPDLQASVAQDIIESQVSIDRDQTLSVPKDQSALTPDIGSSQSPSDQGSPPSLKPTAKPSEAVPQGPRMPKFPSRPPKSEVALSIASGISNSNGIQSEAPGVKQHLDQLNDEAAQLPGLAVANTSAAGSNHMGATPGLERLPSEAPINEDSSGGELTGQLPEIVNGGNGPIQPRSPEEMAPPHIEVALNNPHEAALAQWLSGAPLLGPAPPAGPPSLPDPGPPPVVFQADFDASSGQASGYFSDDGVTHNGSTDGLAKTLDPVQPAGPAMGDDSLVQEDGDSQIKQTDTGDHELLKWFLKSAHD